MSDLISREEAKKVLVDNGYGGNMMFDVIDSIPSADILEHARAIKEYCKDRTNKPIWCNDCPLYEPFCKINTPPNMWDLPEGEKEPPIFTDSAPLKDCKNTAESYGEICVKCNKCGRFGKGNE